MKAEITFVKLSHLQNKCFDFLSWRLTNVWLEV